MTIEQIKTYNDQLEQMLFLHSLQPMAIEELEKMQEKVKELKEAFLTMGFKGIKVVELEEIRFKLAEICYSIIIAINEYLHLNIVDDIRNLKILYRTA
ncbi:hypothetical protein ACUIJN_12740 [Metabacillus halosaccharovorans]|uniref:hypothetical protein n=1 Tax=Metabacillus halosaccharovorans TaxID=930124 RepID=UPI00403D587F